MFGVLNLMRSTGTLAETLSLIYFCLSNIFIYNRCGSYTKLIFCWEDSHASKHHAPWEKTYLERPLPHERPLPWETLTMRDPYHEWPHDTDHVWEKFYIINLPRLSRDFVVRTLFIFNRCDISHLKKDMFETQIDWNFWDTCLITRNSTPLIYILFLIFPGDRKRV